MQQAVFYSVLLSLVLKCCVCDARLDSDVHVLYVGCKAFTLHVIGALWRRAGIAATHS